MPYFDGHKNYIFAKDSIFFVYTNDSVSYVKNFKNSFQHGGISLEDFLADGPILRLSRSLSLSNPEHMMKVMNQFAEGMNLNDILKSHKSILDSLSNSRKQNELIVKKHLKIVDGLAIFEDLEVYEGTLLEQTFTYSSRNPFQKFILPNTGIDLDTLVV